MMMPRSLVILFGALSYAASIQLVFADGGCPDLEGKDAAAHLEYLRSDRAKLSPKCVVASIQYVGGKHYAQASAALIQYLDYPDPVAVARRGYVLEVYPAIDALHSLRKPVVPELTAAIADARTTELARDNAALAILLIYGTSQPEAIATLVNAAHEQTDPAAAIRLMDKAKSLAAKCVAQNRNDCENAVLR
jgi:hypothetical protein